MMIIDWITAIFILAGGWSMLKRFWTLGFLGFFVPQWWKKRRAKKTKEAVEETFQKYGHPFAPLPKLYEALPSPPVGYAWEISVEADNYKNGDDALWLTARLVDVVTSSCIADRKTDLIYQSHYNHMSELNKLWSDHYLGSTEGFILGSALTTFVKNFVDWAEAEKSKVERQNFVGGEYMIKGA